MSSRKTVLLVDDEIFIRQSFADYFEDYLWNTIQASSGEKALEILEKESPDAAVVDIRMGGMDGNTFIRRACKKNPNMVFVIYTGSPEYDVPSDLLNLPQVSNHLFKKPVAEISDLESELLALMEKYHSKRKSENYVS